MKPLFVAAGAAACLVTLPALAQGVDEFGSYGRDRVGDYASPQNFAMELRLGPYRPRVDDEFSGGAPFEQTFGSDRRWLIGLELDWQALRIPYLGTLGPGAGWGYTTMSANAMLREGGGRSSEETSLTIMPMYAVGVLRVDVLARETPIPLVAYGKAGLGAAMWWAKTGDRAHSTDGTLGHGTSTGYQFALGGMFLLDSLDRDASIEMDNSTGVNSSYFFLEWYYSDLDGFGSGKQMNVGANTWMLGLALEM
ncbi:MAG: MXAN_2562 family outer membrane beta-barrel protein [Sorangiineae bacterium]|nr:MXAN_2562 family outer membrane beta-barrel protein [Polyangiaceae bacterium]MEB2323734.1 MXAN_2562 family outer membrane beta-barrel protein [Sorangiineae bacterium]